MQAEIVAMLAAACVGTVEIFKRAGLPERFGPLANLILSAILTAVWAVSEPVWPAPLGIMLGWLAVAASASGVYGLARGTMATRWRAEP